MSDNKRILAVENGRLTLKQVSLSQYPESVSICSNHPTTQSEECNLIFCNAFDNTQIDRTDKEARENHRRNSFVNKPKGWRRK